MRPYFPMRTEVLDVAPIFDDWSQVPGFIVAAIPLNTGAPYPGCEVHMSLDGTTFQYVGSIPEPCIGGGLEATFTNLATSSWDRESSLSLRLDYGTLSSETEDRVLQGFNRAVVADEVIGFANATVDASELDIYTCDTFLRGLAGSSGGGVSTDRFVFLDDSRAGLLFVPCAAVGDSITVRCVGSGYVVTDTLVSNWQKTFTFNAANMSPPAVSHVEGTRDGSNNLTVTWTPSSRFEIPASSSSPEYSLWTVDIMSGATVLRTIEVTAATASYTAAQQTADGLTPGNDVTVRIAQHSYFARGVERTDTV